MDFGQAIESLKKGQKVCREGWNGKGMYIAVTSMSENRKMKPFVYICNPIGELFPWNASQQDLFADDWQVKE
jgi:hypothetical protein